MCKHFLGAIALTFCLQLGFQFEVQAGPDIQAMWDYNQPAASEQKFFETLKTTPCQQEASYCLELQTQIARAQGLQGKFSAGHEMLDQVVRANFGNSPLVETRYLLERGRLLNSAGQPAMAMTLFEQALDLAQQHSLDYYAVDAAHMLGISAPLTEQEAWTLKAIALASQSQDPETRKWHGSLYNNLGWTYFDQGDYAKALDTFQKNVAWHQAQGSRQQSLIIARWAEARTLRALGKYTQALAQLLALEKANAAAGLAPDGYIYEELAENLLALKRQDARSYFAKAYAQLSQDPWLKQNEPERLKRLLQLSK